MKTLIIIPAFCEADNIERVINDISDNYPQYDYLIVNDGSKDDTREIAICHHYNFIDLPINLGIGGAVQAGYNFALRNEYDIAVQLDGDGQHDAAYLQNLIDPIEKGEADVCIGSRFFNKEGFQSSRMRRAGISFLSGLIFLLTRVKIRDVTSGFRAVNKKFISVYAEDYPNDYPEPEAIVTAIVYGGRIKEIPINMKERERGSSSINAARSVYYMIKVTLAILIRRIGYGVRR